jgi:DNA primase small subunit
MDIEEIATAASQRREAKEAKDTFKTFRRDYLKQYYEKAFPFDRICKWLTYSDSKEAEGLTSFNTREISYNLQADGNEEFVVRHLSYANWQKFKEDVLSERNIPLRIDVGAVFDVPPSQIKSLGSLRPPVPQEREYVIDIDMSDYDKIRSCCSGKKLCQLCWKFMWLAQLVLKEALNKQFGFSHILWVFSGRRGIHAWICDERARGMRNDVRAAVTNYLDISVSNDNSDELVMPIVRRSFNSVDGTSSNTFFEYAV